MLKASVTSRRLDEGLASSASGLAKATMAVGLVLLSGSLLTLAWNERSFFLEIRELDRSFVLEEACGTSDALGLRQAAAKVVHLTGCELGGQANFTPATPGLEWLADFQENLPQDGARGAYFKVEVRQYSRRRNAAWQTVSGSLSNLRPTEVFAPRPRIGAREAADGVVARVPETVVPLRQSEHFVRESGLLSHVTPPYTSRNMQMWGDVLYTGDPNRAQTDDIKMWFTVGSSSPVSVLTSQSATGRLEPWLLADGTVVTQVAAGHASKNQQMDAIRSSQSWKTAGIRTVGFVACWLAMWMVFFPEYFDDLFFEKNSKLDKDLGALFRAAPLAAVPALMVILTTWASCQLPWLTAALAAALALLLTLAAFDPRALRQAGAAVAALTRRRGGAEAHAAGPPGPPSLSEALLPTSDPEEPKAEALEAGGAPAAAPAAPAAPVGARPASAASAGHHTAHSLFVGMALGLAAGVVTILVAAVLSAMQ